MRHRGFGIDEIGIGQRLQRHALAGCAGAEIDDGGYVGAAIGCRPARLFAHGITVAVVAVDGEAAFGHRKEAGRPDPVQPDMPVTGRNQRGFNVDIGERLPCRPQAFFRQQNLFVGLAHAVMQAVFGKGQHIVETIGAEAALIHFHAETITRGIGEFGIFFRPATHGKVFLAAGKRRDIAGGPHHHHAGMNERLWFCGCFRLLFLRLPEGVAFRQGQRQKGLEGPVGRARRIIALRHGELRIGIADGEHAVAVGNRLFRPPAQMLQIKPLDLAPGQRLLIGKGQTCPEAAAGETIGHGAPEGECAAILIEPAGEIAGEEASALAVAFGIGIIRLAELRVDQAVKMHGEGDVVIDAAVVAIAIPAVSDIKLVQFLLECLGQAAVEIDAEMIKGHIDHHPEKLPVIIGVIALARRQQITAHIVFLHVGQRFPQVLRRKPQRKPDCGKLHQPLVLLAHVTPIFGMGGIGAVGYSLRQKRPMVEMIAAERKWGDAPERPGETFQIRRRPVEMRGGPAERHSCAALRKIGKKRGETVIQRPPDIGAAFERITMQRIKSGHIEPGHGVMHRVSPFPSFSPCRPSVLPPAARQAAPGGHWRKVPSAGGASVPPPHGRFRDDRPGLC
ncbi:hypothetical protein D3C72_679030 [compost metagenome]